MKIKEVIYSRHSCPLPTPEVIPAWDSWRIVLNPTTGVAKVVTDEGVIGYGMGGEGGRGLPMNVVGPALKGMELNDVGDIEDICKKVEALIPDEATRNRAIGAIDVALWDAVGKASDKSVCELLGGRRQDKIKIYASAGLIYRDPERNVDEAKAFKAGPEGYTAYKFKTAQGPMNDVRAAKLLRKAMGDDYRLILDGHYMFCKSGHGDYMYQPRTVKWIGQEIEKLGYYWYEEPLPHTEVSLNRELKETLTTLLLATGESCATLAEYEALLKNNACDIVQGEPAMFGGISMCRKVIEMARDYGKQFIPHNWGPRLTAAANAQLCAAYPASLIPMNEMSMFANDKHPGLFKWPLVDEIVSKPLEMRDSYVTVPRGAGLGVEVSEEAMKKYPYVDIPYNVYLYSVPTSYMPSIPTNWLRDAPGANRDYFGPDEVFRKREYIW